MKNKWPYLILLLLLAIIRISTFVIKRHNIQMQNETTYELQRMMQMHQRENMLRDLQEEYTKDMTPEQKKEFMMKTEAFFQSLKYSEGTAAEEQ